VFHFGDTDPAGFHTYNADDRTNQIVLFADPQQYPIFDGLIARLDVRSGQDTRTDFISLRHAAAKDVATILTQLVTGQNNAARSNGQEAIRPKIAEASPSRPTEPPKTGGPAPAPTVPAIAAALGITSEPSNQFSMLLTIIPEERSNALMVSFLTIRSLRLEVRFLYTRHFQAKARVEPILSKSTPPKPTSFPRPHKCSITTPTGT
jgi:general secretion pathway protein D